MNSFGFSSCSSAVFVAAVLALLATPVFTAEIKPDAGRADVAPIPKTWDPKGMLKTANDCLMVQGQEYPDVGFDLWPALNDKFNRMSDDKASRPQCQAVKKSVAAFVNMFKHGPSVTVKQAVEAAKNDQDIPNTRPRLACRDKGYICTYDEFNAEVRDHLVRCTGGRQEVENMSFGEALTRKALDSGCDWLVVTSLAVMRPPANLYDMIYKYVYLFDHYLDIKDLFIASGARGQRLIAQETMQDDDPNNTARPKKLRYKNPEVLAIMFKTNPNSNINNNNNNIHNNNNNNNNNNNINNNNNKSQIVISGARLSSAVAFAPAAAAVLAMLM